MSADNYFLICRHPDGGYAAVMMFASDESEIDSVPSESFVEQGFHNRFDTIEEAYETAASGDTEYGVTFHPDVKDVIPHKLWRVLGDKVTELETQLAAMTAHRDQLQKDLWELMDWVRHTASVVKDMHRSEVYKRSRWWK